MNLYLGEFAALATSLLFSMSSTLFTVAGQKVGSTILNRARLILAVAWLTLAHLLFKVPFPWNAGVERWSWLAISGVIGLVLGDTLLFQAFVWIGPRLSMLLMALAPALAALLAWVFLGEILSLGQIVGIALTLGGIGWVVMDHNGRTHPDQETKKQYALGLLCGLGAAAGQAIGLITAKLGAGGNFPALSGTLMRMLAAAATIWVIALFQRQANDTIKKLVTQPRVILLILGGSFIGPFLGVTASLLAIQNAEIGIASTLMALPPVILLPIGYFFFREKFGWQSIVGTLLAMAGVALLFLV